MLWFKLFKKKCVVVYNLLSYCKKKMLDVQAFSLPKIFFLNDDIEYEVKGQGRGLKVPIILHMESLRIHKTL